MYTDRRNINILTSVMLGHGIDTVVVCPGSRNAPLAHNFMQAGFKCYSVTDERSAGFYALGLALALKKPVAVCVTSGSAVLNLAPAVAEAAYRQLPLIVVSADRPQGRIGQLEGQTIQQPGVFGAHAGACYSLPEPCDSASAIYCNRMANEAMLAATRGVVVHVNVPVTEPLYNFTEAELPSERIIRRIGAESRPDYSALSAIIDRLDGSRRPMILVGQMPASAMLTDAIEALSRRYVVLYESLSSERGGVDFDAVLADCDDRRFYPDFVLYAGHTFVSNRIKAMVKAAEGAEVWAISSDGVPHDTFNRLTGIIDGNGTEMLIGLARMAQNAENCVCASEYKALWDAALQSTRKGESPDDYSEQAVVRAFEEAIGDGSDCTVHYANSSAIRYGNRYSRHYNYVNRGVNGIEGSLSAAAGFSLAAGAPVYCVIGDLSFFYDCNALWQPDLSGNFRVLLLNNGGGGIFRTLKGAVQSPAFSPLISAAHGVSARGVCESYGVEYRAVSDASSLQTGLSWLVSAGGDRPMLLECLF